MDASTEAVARRADLERYRWLRDQIGDLQMRAILGERIIETELRLVELGKDDEASDDAAPVQVFAAASLANALGDAIIGFRQAGGGLVKATYGSSAKLARLINAGAAADIFISADQGWMNDVQSNHRLKEGTRFDFLSNALVLVEPVGGTAAVEIEPGFPLESMLGDGRLAIADPNTVPAGIYGKAALQRLGVWNAVVSKLARAEDVRAAQKLVSTKAAPFGIVYQTDARVDNQVKITGFFPADAHPPIIYPAALLASSRPAAAAFLDYLRSGAAKAFFSAQGFAILAQSRAFSACSG